MKITILIAALVSTYFLMLNVAVNKEAENKAKQMQKTKMASDMARTNTQTAGL